VHPFCGRIEEGIGFFVGEASSLDSVFCGSVLQASIPFPLWEKLPMLDSLSPVRAVSEPRRSWQDATLTEMGELRVETRGGERDLGGFGVEIRVDRFGSDAGDRSD